MRCPCGTTYPPNLRIYMQGRTVDQWVKTAKTAEMRPPMPWFDLHEVSEPDLRALYVPSPVLGARAPIAFAWPLAAGHFFVYRPRTSLRTAMPRSMTAIA